METAIRKKIIQCVIETLIFDIIIYLYFFQFSAMRENFITMNIHPFLIVSLITGIKYGNYPALFGSLVSSILFIISYLTLGKDIYLFITDFAHYKFILMFVLTSIIIGRFRDLYVTEITDLKQKNENLETEYIELKEVYDKTKFIKDELKKQIIGTEDSILSLYNIAYSLESLYVEEIYTELMSVLSIFLKAERVSIYTYNEKKNLLRLKVRMGEDTKLPNVIDLEENENFRNLVHEKKVAKKTVYSDKWMPVLFSPIISKGKIIGVINIEKMDFKAITEYAVNLFKMISDWTSKSIERAHKVQEILTKNQYYLDHKIFKFSEYFKKRLTEEIRRKELYNMEYGYLKYKNKDLTLEKIYEIFSPLLRDQDFLAYDKEIDIIHILLPVCEKDKVRIINRRILKTAMDHLILIK